MFDIVLFQPEIPPNTGNIIRLCANTGTRLHLIHPLGFKLDDKQLRRAGLDYSEFADILEYDSYADFMGKTSPLNIYGISTKGSCCYTEINYRPGDTLMFGPETRGLPDQILNSLGLERVLRIPMQTNSRSLNLSNAVAVILYEALRQNDFCFATPEIYREHLT
jgi:tRNA (cytidine/uridine-2'-O-)-methyltransferase